MRQSAPDVVCLGILVADVVARPLSGLPAPGSLALVEEICLRGGGCALNTATALTRLGVRAACAGRVGKDPFGRFLLGLLDERGVDRAQVLEDADAPTAATIVLVDAAGERTFLHLAGANGQLRAAHLDIERLLTVRALHVAGALVMPGLDGEPTAAILAEARARGVMTSLDTVWDATGTWDRLDPCLPQLDLLCVSLAEAVALSGEAQPEDAARWACDRGVGGIAITLGADGCYVHDESFSGYLPAPPVHVVDSTGAGDGFAAGLIYGRLHGWSLERSALLANAVGAAATTAVGAAEGLPTLEQVLM